MDFFKQQEIARRKTAFLLVYFVLAVLFVIIIFNLMFFAIYSVSTPGADYAAELKYRLTHIYWEHPTAAIVLIIFYGSAWRHVQLIDGGKAVAALVGATLVNMQSRDVSIKRYINVVEEITIGMKLLSYARHSKKPSHWTRNGLPLTACLAFTTPWIIVLPRTLRSH